MSGVEDRLAIADLFTRYCCALDNGEVETVVDCFTADAVLKSPMIDLAGHAAIRDFVGRFAAQRVAGVQFRHMVTNIAATVDGDRDRATATAYLLVLVSQNGAHRTLPPGRYECGLIKEGSAWRFTRRVVLHDHEYSLDAIRDP
jgi:ketosteroid isomerase-like protein